MLWRVPTQPCVPIRGDRDFPLRQTRLPLKRKVYVGGGEADFFTEVYAEFVVDPELDAKVFALPK